MPYHHQEKHKYILKLLTLINKPIKMFKYVERNYIKQTNYFHWKLPTPVSFEVTRCSCLLKQRKSGNHLKQVVWELIHTFEQTKTRPSKCMCAFVFKLWWGTGKTSPVADSKSVDNKGQVHKLPTEGNRGQDQTQVARAVCHYTTP